MPSQITLATWNCQGALRGKWPLLSDFGADVIVVQECEDPARSEDTRYRNWASSNHLWIGASRHKGLGIFTQSNWAKANFSGLDWHTDARYFLAAAAANIPICGVWTQRGILGPPYIGQLHLALDTAPDWLDNPFCVLLGDFNSNVIWDKAGRDWGHAKTTARLAERGFRSAYHCHFGAEQGGEPHPTFHLQRNPAKPYHIDYVYIGRGWQVLSCDVGAPADWAKCSDHLPIIVRLARAAAPDNPARR